MSFIFYFIVFALCINCCRSSLALQVKSLGHYGGDKEEVSMSGFSSGSFMSCQYHVAFSKEIKGVALFCGGLYYCARNMQLLGVPGCIQAPLFSNVETSIAQVNQYASLGLIDPPSNLAFDKVFIYNAGLDTLVNPFIGNQIREFYEHYSSDTLNENIIFAGHAMPTEGYGLPCPMMMLPFMNNCEYHGAYKALNHIYGNLVKPTTNVQLTGDFFMFDQKEFVVGPPCLICMDDVGYAYVPKHCQTNTGCRVHVVHHGCFMTRLLIGDSFARYSGYNEVAELNNIIVIYPLMINCLAEPQNILGCHDWTGHVDKYYATKNGTQIKVMHKIIERVLSIA